jgi:hypothetical protein
MAEKLNSEGWLDLKLFHTVFIEHVVADIKFCTDNKRFIAAAQLLMSAIDTAAGLTRPADCPEATRQEFIEWANRYLRLSGPDYTLTGTDLYAARCGLLHGYTPEAKLVRLGKAAMLGWVDNVTPPVWTNEDHSLVLVSLTDLCVAFAAGLSDTMQRINRDEYLAGLVNGRLGMMFKSEDIDPVLKAKLEADAVAYRAHQAAAGR